ncbi:hypothetical protein [Limnovirga soli]|uniref:Uncharacterized protein n=1 Tax=Limnovirga soli TaxID=2656915 RepID=A0A8J8JQV9_9BACT|nr:hypothetical protein [Limnovirga soli]NNV55172.1 hypothetical protein [Limnovirga soli]
MSRIQGRFHPLLTKAAEECNFLERVISSAIFELNTITILVKYTTFSLLIAMLLLGCNNLQDSKAGNERQDTSKIVPVKIDPIKQANNKLLGIWSDGSSENATFIIKSDSVYYVDQFKSYKYVLNDDSIKIIYPDWIYAAKVIFKNDTLILESEDGTSEFLKFKK